MECVAHGHSQWSTKLRMATSDIDQPVSALSSNAYAARNVHARSPSPPSMLLSEPLTAPPMHPRPSCCPPYVQCVPTSRRPTCRAASQGCACRGSACCSTPPTLAWSPQQCSQHFAASPAGVCMCMCVCACITTQVHTARVNDSAISSTAACLLTASDTSQY